MRFDGYHMLVDLLGMHNLSARAFAHANWRLRQILFATDEPVPEHFPPGLKHFLVAFAWGTMIYRLTLFLGIAYLVYTMFPKAVGIPLAAIEVLFFIVFPVIRELKEWYAMGPATLFNTRRGKITLALLLGLVVLAVLPLDRSISVPAVMLPAEESWVYPPEPAQIISFDVKSGDHVVEGQRIARLFVPEISFRLRQAVLRLAIVEERLKRLASDAKERATSQVAVQEREAILEELLGLKKRAGLLQIKAPRAGVISGGGDPRLPGMWLGHADMLVHITSEEGSLVSGLVTERYAGRLQQGAHATFVSEDGARSPTSGVLVDIGAPGSEGQGSRG